MLMVSNIKLHNPGTTKCNVCIMHKNRIFLYKKGEKQKRNENKFVRLQL